MSDRAIADQISRRRTAAAEAWDLANEFVLIGSGDLIPMPGRHDRVFPFRSHPEYFYLTDRERPGGVLAFDAADGWVDFVAPVTAQERLWSATDDYPRIAPDEVLDAGELDAWVAARSGRRCALLGSAPQGFLSDRRLEEDLRYALTHLRRPKDHIEIFRMRRAQAATRAGFARIAELISPGRTERELQIELEAEFMRGGADSLAFDTIVAGGPHSAVLHFTPGNRPLLDGELVLVDAGGEYCGYASDVTRTYATSGRLTAEQSFLVSLVRRAEMAAIDMCRPGTQWREVHRVAALVLGEGLVELGILRGDPESLLEQGAISLFFPHGVGHMVGLGIRDAGGALRNQGDPEPGFPTLRVDLPLEAGYAMTVEPGIYFVPALLGDSSERERHHYAVDWQRVERLVGFGGIRIEDNVLIAEDGPEVLTSDIPVPG